MTLKNAIAHVKAFQKNYLFTLFKKRTKQGQMKCVCVCVCVLGFVAKTYIIPIKLIFGK